MMATKNAKIGPVLAALFLVFLVSTTAGAATISVPGDYSTITAAMNAAVSVDTVEVAAGTYSPSANGEVFPINIKNGVALVGAGADVTVIDSEGYTSLEYICQGWYGCYWANVRQRVIKFSGTSDPATTLQGFTITGGNGGILVENGSAPTIDSCIIANNGDWNYWGTPNGGGIRVHNSAPCITNCTIVNNSAGYGGGMSIYSTGGSYEVKVVNCTISANESPGFGGGVFIQHYGPMVTLVNSIIWGNTSRLYYGPPYDDEDIKADWGHISIHYCDYTKPVAFQYGPDSYPSYSSITESNTFDADPQFDVDFSLLPGSPCIGAGAGDLGPYTGDCVPCEGVSMPDMGATSCEQEPSNNPPTANAGPDVTITEDDVDTTTIQGLASDPDASDVLYYRWSEGAVVLLDWTEVTAAGGYCPLALSGLGLGVGVHTLTLEVKDAEFTVSDYMVLTIEEVNHPPVADAGENLQILSEDQAYTVIEGTASDEDGDALEYRWLEGAAVLADWSLVGTLGEAYLDLAGVPYLPVGDHVLTLEVRETSTPEQLTASDEMTLTIENSPPMVNAQPNTQTVEIGVDPIYVQGVISDFDGDTVSYEWFLGSESLGSGSVATILGGDPVSIPDLYIAAGDPRFTLGDHTIVLVVNDGVNDSVSDSVTVTVQDSTGPSLGPVTCPPMGILWPPNHKLVPITICAYAFDNNFSGDITLAVRVESSEPPNADADGNTIPDVVYIPDQENCWSWDEVTGGTINLELRSERQGTGSGRIYTIFVTATDASGNFTEASLTVLAPHDKRKK